MELFETYNFTIDENTPVDVELSIDPEMLGRIFENLLAEINPETGETARKATGSYYTPRPIVEYMVNECLKQHLVTKTNIDESKIAALLSYADDDGAGLTDSQKNSVVDAMHSIKILDPACGSGAFPIGILHKILLVLQKIDPEARRWLERMLIGVKDSVLKAKLKQRIKQPNYLRKLGIIRDCIFGVDIQPIAAEISKLRCFLSLIVDEEIDNDAENRGIEALPNLEFKFLTANTLIGLPRKQAQHAMFEDTESIDNLKELRDEYLSSWGKDKDRIEKEFRNVQAKMFRHALQWEGKESQTSKLAIWNPFSHESNGWFDPEWMFGLKDGFDIIIANPPYSAKQSLETKHYTKFYNCVEYKCDPYAFFIEFGLNCLKKGGQLAFIVPVTWMTNYYYAKLRGMMINSASLRQIALIEGLVFESANVDTSLLFLQKEMVSSRKFIWIKTSPSLAKITPIVRSYESVEREDRFDITPSCDAAWDQIRAKMDGLGIRLDTISTISLGMKLQKNDLFVSDAQDKNHPDPIIFGKDISLYGYLKPVRFFNYKKAVIIGGTKKESVHLAKPKILVQAIRNLSLERRIVASVDTAGYYFIGTVNGIILKSSDYDIRFVLGLFNSKLINYYFRNRFTTISLTSAFLGAVPIIDINKVSESSCKKLITLVEDLLEADRKYPNRDNTHFKQEIDRFVNQLYKLTPDEIAVVENSYRESEVTK